MRKWSVVSLFLLLAAATVAGGQGRAARQASPDLRDLEGWAADSSGKPLAGVEVWILKFGDRPYGWTRGATTDRGGRFEIRQALSDESDGDAMIRSVILKTCLKGYVPTNKWIIAGNQEVSTKISMEPAGRISGRVVGSSGRPIAGARVFLYESDCDPLCVDSAPLPASPCAEGDHAVTDTRGAFALQPLAAGSYQLSANAPGYLPLEDRGPKAATGETGITLVLSPAN